MTSGCGSARDSRRVIGGAVLGCHVLVDGQLSGKPLVDSAQTLDPHIDRVTITFEPDDLVVELSDDALHDLTLTHGLQGMLFRSRAGAVAQGQAQRNSAEQNDRRRPGLPAQSSIQSQQRTDHRGLLVAATPGVFAALHDLVAELGADHD